MNKVELNKDMRLSPHFTIGELTKTSYHTLDGNIPSRVAIENLKRICGWLEILRERYNTRYGDGVSPPELGGVRGGLNDSRSGSERQQKFAGSDHPVLRTPLLLRRGMPHRDFVGISE